MSTFANETCFAEPGSERSAPFGVSTSSLFGPLVTESTMHEAPMEPVPRTVEIELAPETAEVYSVVEKLLKTEGPNTAPSKLEAVDLLLSKLAAKSSGVGAWYWPLESSRIVWSDENYKLFEKTREEFTGDWRQFESYVYSEDRNALKQWLQDQFERIRPLKAPTVVPLEPRLTFRVPRKDGTLRWVEAKGKCYIDQPGKYYLVGVNADTTQQIELDDQRIQIETLQARVAEQAKFKRDLVQFIDSIAHEMRNPMHGVLGNIEILEELIDNIRSIAEELRNLSKGASNELENVLRCTSSCACRLDDVFSNATESLDALKECIRHQKEVLDDSLLFSKLDSVKVEPKPERCCLLDVGRSLVRMYRHSLHGSRKNVQLRLVFEDSEGESIPADTPESEQLLKDMFTVWTDSMQIKTIFSNLISNSLKFTEQGHVTFTIRQLDAFDTFGDNEVEGEEKVRIRFSVEDTGCGMDPEDIPCLFERFRQLPNAANNQTQVCGSGLGLYICDKILKLFDSEAKIHVESKKGEGSRFWFELTFHRCGSTPSNTPPSSNRTDQEERQSKASSALSSIASSTVFTANTEATEATITGKAELIETPGTASSDGRLATTDYLAEGTLKTTGLETVFSEATLSFLPEGEVNEPSAGDTAPSSSSPSLSSSDSISPSPVKRALKREKKLRPTTHLPVIDPLPVAIVQNSNNDLRVLTSTPPNERRLAKSKSPPMITDESSSSSQAVHQSSGPQESGGLHTNKHTAVICEDSPINARILQRLCEQRGFETVVLSDGKLAIEFFEALLDPDPSSTSTASRPQNPQDIRIVFCDIMMPYYSGFAVAKRIRELERKKAGDEEGSSSRIPVVGLSGHGRAEHRAEALAAGFDELLSKPVPRQVLNELLTKYAASSGDNPRTTS